MRRGWVISLPLIGLAFVVLFVLPLPPTVRYSLGQIAVFLLLGAAALLIPTSLSAWQRLTRPLVRRIFGNEGALGGRQPGACALTLNPDGCSAHDLHRDDGRDTRPFRRLST